MGDRVRIEYEPLNESTVRCRIDVIDSSIIGKGARFRIIRKVNVKYDNPVNKSDVIADRKIDALQIRNVVDLHRAEFEAFSYRGRRIDIELHTELKIDDGILFDTKLSEETEVKLGRPAISGSAQEIIEPQDSYDLMRNLSALTTSGKFAAGGMLIVAAIVIGINSLVALHDQFVPESNVWFYDQTSSRGRTEFPLVKSLLGSGAVGLAVWLGLKRQLRKYMNFELHKVPARICRGDSIPISALVRGKANVDLENIVVRVVACNMEKGQYVTRRGRNRSTRSFTEPSRVVLYEKRIDRVTRDTSIETFLTGSVDFGPMFRGLYPPQRVTSTHGLDVYWEIQLLHEQFVDQELVGPVECFPWREFVAA